MTKPAWPPPDGPELIAVIGMAGRFPGADDVGQYWRNLCAETDSITRSNDELRVAGTSPDRLADPKFVAAEAVLSDITGFDADFFGIPPRDAELMDPQHRLALEATWAAFDSAGLVPQEVDGHVGVFLGAGLSMYLVNNLLPNRELMDSAGALSVLLHNDKDYLATTVSHRLGLRGPSLAVGTACSSSLVAVHLACQSLLGLESDVAVAGGVSLQVPPGQGHLHTAGGIYSADGRCRAFDAAADGTVGGSGTGIVLLKRWTDAVRDGDHVHAVLLGSAVNNDGAGRMGFTAPGVDGQTAVIVEAHAAAGVHADEIGYLEAHGTGTSLGDAIEVSALKRAFANRSPGSARCGLGSVKTNIGHLDVASGVAGLIKTVLAVEEGIIPATLHFRTPNPELGAGPFRIIDRTQPWPADGPRTAGVSSFGMGGTNAHLVVRSAPPLPEDTGWSRPAAADVAVPLVLSARDDPGLATAGRDLAEHLETHPDLPLDGVARTLAGRTPMARRAVVIGRTRTERLDALRHLTDPGTSPVRSLSAGAWSGSARPVVLVLTGEETGHPQARNINVDRWIAYWSADPVFAHDYRSCMTEFVVPGDAHSSSAAKSFAASYGIVRALLASGLHVSAILGRGTGEYPAAALTGVLSLADAVRLRRSRAESSSSYAAAAGDVPSAAPRIPCLSAATGSWVGTEGVGAPHWLELPAAPDRFAAAIQIARSLPEVLIHRIEPPIADEPEMSPDPRWHALAELWTAGAGVHWTAALTIEAPARRVSLPPRPLHHQHFWVDPPMSDLAEPSVKEEERNPGQRLGDLPPRLADTSKWLWQPGWQRTTVLAPPAESADVRCLVLTNGPIGDAVAARLQAIGAHVTTARPPADAADAPAAIAGLMTDMADQTGAGDLPTHVAHLWAVDHPERTIDDIGAQTALGLHTVLNLVRADAAVPSPGLTRLLMVTRGAYEVLGGDLQHPSQAMLGAVAKVVPLEYPQIAASVLDLPPVGQAGSTQALATSVVTELMTAPGFPIVAARGRHRWVSDVVPSRPTTGTTTVPAAGGVYLVTGGLGAIGLALGESLAQRPAAVVLVSRRAFPGRFDWEHLTAGPPEADGEIARTVRRLLAAEKAGGEFLVLQADVTDEDEMRGVMAVARTFGPIKGVVHAAGLPDLAGMVQRRTAADTEEILAAKVTGTLVLERVLAGQRLDFFVLCSSLGTVLHKLKFGEIGYLAANEFLNAFATQQAANGHPETVSIAWTDWVEDGMSARARPDRGHSSSRSSWLEDPLRGITEAEGVAIFEQVITTRPGALVLVSTQDLGEMLRRHDAVSAAEHHELMTGPLDSRVGSDHDEAALDPAADVAQRLTRVWEELLGIRGISPDDDFFQLGGDSLVALQLIRLAERDLGIELSLTRIFERSTLREVVADALAARHAGSADDVVVIDQ